MASAGTVATGLPPRAAPPREGPLRSTLVAGAVCLTCSLLVAGSVVLLRPFQLANRERERERHVLALVESLPGLRDLVAHPGTRQVTARVIDLETGTYVPALAPSAYDLRTAPRDPHRMHELPEERDLAGLGRRPRRVTVYLVLREGALHTVVLPVQGRGYLSMLWGYLAVAGDGSTIRGLTFYEHAETPGLGSEITSPEWLELWAGQRLFDEAGALRIRVAEGRAEPGDRHAVDGISGATRTSQGVGDLVRFWAGPDGFGPYLERIRAGGYRP